MEYKKDFEGWNRVKKEVDAKVKPFTFREKEIWWCSTGINVGIENDGKGRLFKRPVYVLKKINQQTFLGLPVTSTLKEDATHVSFYFEYTLNTAIISQIKSFDSKRLIERMGNTSDYLHKKIKKTTVAFILS